MRLKGGSEMQLGQTIQQIRKDNNLTQEGFAELFHVTRQTVSNWENEKSYPDLLTLVAISDRFNISLDKMLKEDIKMTEKLNKEIKWSKKAKGIIGVVVGIPVIVAIVWFIVWNYNKSLSEDKFQNGLSNYQYEIDESCEKGGYYIIQYDENTYFTLLNQSMPGYLDFSTDFHAKDVRCYVKSGDETIMLLSWALYDGDTKDIYIDDTKKLTDSYEKKYSELIKFGCDLYNAVYR